jgi:transcriptional regulator with XRE-family HTH domain
MGTPEKVTRRRTQLGLKQADVVRITGLPSSRVSELESGKYNAPPPVLLQVARALQTTVDWLIDDSAEEPPAADLTNAEWSVVELMRDLNAPAREVRALIAKAFGGSDPEPGRAIREVDLVTEVPRSDQKAKGEHKRTDAADAPPRRR